MPISVTTLGANQLQTANVSELSGISKITPSLRFDNQGGWAQPSIRSIGTGVVTSGGGANVGIYVDGFYSPNPLAADFQRMKVKSVQVLKGPQAQRSVKCLCLSFERIQEGDFRSRRQLSIAITRTCRYRCSGLERRRFSMPPSRRFTAWKASCPTCVDGTTFKVLTGITLNDVTMQLAERSRFRETSIAPRSSS